MTTNNPKYEKDTASIGSSMSPETVHSRSPVLHYQQHQGGNTPASGVPGYDNSSNEGHQSGHGRSYSYTSVPAYFGPTDHNGAPKMPEPEPSKPAFNRNISEQWQSEHGGQESKYNTPLQKEQRKNNLEFADGDVPAGAKTWNKLMSKNIVLRWAVFIIPITFILWIPGIISLASSNTSTLLSTRLHWWSAWFTVVWVGWWAATLVAKIAPTVLRNTLGLVAPELKRYIEFLIPTQKYVTFFGWTIAVLVSFQPLVYHRSSAIGDTSRGHGRDLYYFSRGLLGLMISALILLLEKVFIQVIATNFHKTSYKDRIQAQKFKIHNLVILYINSRNIGRSDTLDEGARAQGHARRPSANPAKIVKNVIKGVRTTAKTAATALGTVASEMAGERVLQPNSPASMVQNAVASSKKSRHLARRIFYSFVGPSKDESLRVEHILTCFRSYDEACACFEMFDRDGNGDATIDEIEMSCLDIHREYLALTSSMKDLDSAVGRLDAILVSIWYIVALIIIIALISTNFTALLSSAGTMILGLSWMISLTAQEILASIVFLFVKHAYDVTDRVDIDGENLVVKEINLLFTVFQRLDGKIVQMPHSLLNTKPIHNVRRSNAISEDFSFDVDFLTDFDKINSLRERMLTFVKEEKRDFFPAVDIAIKDFAEQGKLTLVATIRYKSNWQNTSLTIQRRNKWLCALKSVMAELEIYGPLGAGNPAPEDIPQIIKFANSPPADAVPSYSSATGGGGDDDHHNNGNGGGGGGSSAGGSGNTPAAFASLGSDRLTMPTPRIDTANTSQPSTTTAASSTAAATTSATTVPPVSPAAYTFNDPRSTYEADEVFFADREHQLDLLAEQGNTAWDENENQQDTHQLQPQTSRSQQQQPQHHHIQLDTVTHPSQAERR